MIIDSGFEGRYPVWLQKITDSLEGDILLNLPEIRELTAMLKRIWLHCLNMKSSYESEDLMAFPVYNLLNCRLMHFDEG